MRMRDSIIVGALVGFLFGITNSHSTTFKQAQLVISELIVRNHLQSMPLYLTTSGSVNAQTDGKMVLISDWFLGLIANKDELAIILGHELAHANPHKFFIYQKDEEYYADGKGFQYARNAGFNACHGIEWLKKMDEDESSDHPADSDRFDHLNKWCK